MHHSPEQTFMAHEILIVDDEPDIRLLIEGILQDEGYETRQAGDSTTAIAAFRARCPSLVILDIWLQGSRLDGLGILRALLGEERAGIVATACNDHEGTIHSREWPLVGACFDADRFTLGRVGIDPDPRYFSLILDDPAFSEMVRFARAASDAPPKWADLFAEFASA